MEHDNGGSRAIKVSSRKYKNYISLAVIVAGAFLLRVYGLGSLPYNYDEPKNIEIIARTGRFVTRVRSSLEWTVSSK